jgi:geranylgeranyl diphosphate synthase type II
MATSLRSSCLLNTNFFSVPLGIDVFLPFPALKTTDYFQFFICHSSKGQYKFFPGKKQDEPQEDFYSLLAPGNIIFVPGIYRFTNPCAMQLVQQYQQMFEAYRTTRPFDGQPEGLYAPVNYIMDLGGKRLRPAMALMGYGLFQEDASPALPLAYAVEIFHNFTLVHDDIMDDAPLRRGKPTVHALYNTNTAILAGDVMLILAYEQLLQIKPALYIPAILGMFNQVAREVCEGQQMDMDFESRGDVTIPEYLRMIELKTSVLLAGSLAMGAILAGASSDDVQRLYRFGCNAGIAFQLQDDILDAFGDPQKVGKKPGGDIAQNKKTFLLLKALEIASGKAQQQLRHLLHDPGIKEEQKIDEVISLFIQLGIPSLAAGEKQRFRDLAMSDLDGVRADPDRKNALRMLAEALIEREY